MTVEKGLRIDQVQDYGYQMDNLLVNGNFEIWQRGNGPFTTMQAFTADEWYMYRNSGVETASVTRVTSPVKVGNYAIQNVTAMNGGQAVHLIQGIENYKSLEGLTLTFSVWVKCSTPGAVRTAIEDYNGSTFSSSPIGGIHTGSGNWERLTTIKTIRTGLAPTPPGVRSHGMGINIFISSIANTTFQADGATLVIGNYPEGVPFVPETGYDEIVRCMRYYQRYSSYQMGLYSIGGSGMVVDSPLPVMMYGTAVVTHITDGLTGNATALTLLYNAGACQSLENILNINPTGVGGCVAEFALECP